MRGILNILFIALGFACSLAINVWLFYRVSGGMFNPAVSLPTPTPWLSESDFTVQVTFTLWLVRAVPTVRCLVVFLAQILGAIAAAGVASAILPGELAVNVRLGGGASIARGVFIEMFTTIMLVFTVIMLAAVKHRATYLAPIGHWHRSLHRSSLAVSLQSCSNMWIYKPVRLTRYRYTLHWCRYQPSSCIWACCCER